MDAQRLAAVEGLDKLAAELDEHTFLMSFAVSRLSPWPALYISNRRMGRLAEHVFAGHDAFWWGWAERIAPLSDVAGAAAAIARVLRDTR
jgi:hypothetical protein